MQIYVYFFNIPATSLHNFLKISPEYSESGTVGGADGETLGIRNIQRISYLCRMEYFPFGSGMQNVTISNEDLFGEVTSLLREGRTVTIPVKGSSMAPFIIEGRDSVVLEGIEDCTPEGQERKEAKIGDIVLFKAEGKYYLHRILRIENNVAEIQGDGILRSKERCATERIFGRVVAVLKNGKKQVNVNSLPYRLKIRIWLSLHPCRRILLGIWRRLPK